MILGLYCHTYLTTSLYTARAWPLSLLMQLVRVLFIPAGTGWIRCPLKIGQLLANCWA